MILILLCVRVYTYLLLLYDYNSSDADLSNIVMHCNANTNYYNRRVALYRVRIMCMYTCCRHIILS